MRRKPPGRNSPPLERVNSICSTRIFRIIDLRQDDKLVVRQAHPAVAEDAEGGRRKPPNTQGKTGDKTGPEAKPGLTPVSAPAGKKRRDLRAGKTD